MRCSLSGLGSAGVEDFHGELGMGDEFPDEGFDLVSVEATETGADGWDGGGGGAAECEFGVEGLEAGGDVFEPAGVAPVVLVGQVGDGAAVGGVVEDDGAGFDEATAAVLAVLVEHFGVLGFERLGESGVHDADAVDGVDEDLGCGAEDVAGFGYELGRWSTSVCCGMRALGRRYGAAEREVDSKFLGVGWAGGYWPRCSWGSVMRGR